MNAFQGGAADGEGLLARRQRNFGASSVLFYRDPIEMVRGAGCWMEAVDGTRYLDFYNNVPSVGHCHPRVVEAIRRQVGELNINSRYLHALTETYLERLKATLPESLSNIALACTGSEANDLALRVAMGATGGTGFVVTETAYHGNTSAVIAVSPASLKRGKPPAHVRAVPPPGESAYGADIAGGFAMAVRRAIGTLKRRGHAFAGLICDSIFSSDGVFADPPGFLAEAVAVAHEAGGLFIADEVQPGFGRTGSQLWGFARHGVAPDIVTMGKPMGNGYPMAGMATRPEHLARFCRDVGYFNTFGGTPVAAAAGLAVLDVIEEDGLCDNAVRIGTYLKSRLEVLAGADPRIAAVRGAGLFIGLDLSASGDPARPDPVLASALINGLRDRRVLIGAAGKFGHTLKIRPPLCLTRKEADFFVDALSETLGSLPAG
ncbi:MAG: aminotransferase class III-fold pyridoxal phosphate-dependent enzyme [Pseudomonadota bacterium]